MALYVHHLQICKEMGAPQGWEMRMQKGGSAAGHDNNILLASKQTTIAAAGVAAASTASVEYLLLRAAGWRVHICWQMGVQDPTGLEGRHKVSSHWAGEGGPKSAGRWLW